MKWVLAPVVAGSLVAGALAVVALSVRAPAQTAGRQVIEMTEMRFSPNRLDFKVGESVTVTLVNRGEQRHDLAFPSIQMPGLAGVETLTMPGRTTTVTLRFDQPGEYQFLCTIPGHAAAGMTGAVFVTP